MQYTAEIFKLLYGGGFLSSNHNDGEKSNWWKDLEENFPEYRDFYGKLNLILKKTPHYAHFGRDEKTNSQEDRQERMLKVLLLGNAMKNYDSEISSGGEFSKHLLLQTLEIAQDFLEAASNLTDGNVSNDKLADIIIDRMKHYGFAECVDERLGKYSVLGAFKYAEALRDLVNFSGASQDELHKTDSLLII